MKSSIIAENLSLEYRMHKKRRIIPGFKRKGEIPLPQSTVGGDFVFSRKQPKLRALNDLSFTLEPGDRLGLIGANGAGKSTLLMVLAQIYQPTAGRLTVEGRVDALFNIGLGFRPEATGRRNIVLRGLINGWSSKLIAERMDEIIEFSELGDFIDMPYKSYSQGMAARLAFSIATAVTPEILLLDEWIGAGDTDFQKKAKDRMLNLVEDAGIMVIASHNHSLLKQTCNRILHLEHGRILKLGPVDEVIA
ncbi:ABC transporter ATP-binding protein [Phyllobacterium sp. YR531]|uniref:ABC transporter ATP-binding protein n=1 Tax=Phyllobacterium sp. YR531 TaxID=1144343 RepID=UPI00026FB276|nr:ABC transporter ATP-binding protein [Phyllobacterium sp. YR531]EJN02281.1 ABC-type polysaccharide/polyol phosphate transport system, ATPase component [Phyllobacterium sp. YR531]